MTWEIVVGIATPIGFGVAVISPIIQNIMEARDE